MANQRDCWGIEVGANAIKAIRLIRSGDQVSLAEYEVLPFKQVVNAPNAEGESEVQVNLDRFVQRHDLSKTPVVVSVSGNAAFARFAKLPPVEPKQVPAIVEFEAVQQIPFPIDQVEWDYQVFQQEDSPDVEVGIFAITKERVAEYLANYRAVGLRVDGLTLSPLAVFNALVYDRQLGEDTKGLILLDIGSSSTDLIIVEGGGIWLRTMPIGGNNFTEVLMRAFKTSYAKAEKLKREAGTSKYARQIFQAMRPVFEDLVQEIQRSLGYYQGINREAELTHLVGMGSTFRLPGIQKFLKQKLQLEVTRLDQFERISAPERQEADFADVAVNMATAYGLALQGLDLAEVNANILPSPIIRARLWKRKEPIMLAAASLMLLASGAAAFQQFRQSAAFDASFGPESAAFRQVNAIVQDAQNQEREVRAVQSDDPRPRINLFRSMLDYRDLWPKLAEDLSHAMLAVQRDPEQLGPDASQWLALPRSQNDRIILSSVTARYQPPPAVDPSGEGASPAGGAGFRPPAGGGGMWDEDEFGGGGRPAGGGFGGGTPRPAAGQPTDLPAIANGAGVFQIEVSGIVFRTDQSAELIQNFHQQLRRNATPNNPVIRDGFPFAPFVRERTGGDFDTSERSVQNWSEVLQLVYSAEAAGTARPGARTQPGTTPRPTPTPIRRPATMWDEDEFGGFGPGVRPPQGGAAAGPAAGLPTIDELLPVRPPLIEVGPEDAPQAVPIRRFTVRWWVRVLDQEQVRQSRRQAEAEQNI